MCGIFGVFTAPGRLPSRAAATAALTALAHRGPDAQGLLLRPELGLALGHARLGIIDPAARSDQPFHGDGTVLVFNGEVFNFRRLRAELERLGAVFTTGSDTEVVAVGYRHWGLGVFDRLHGMFALALYDERDGSLHLARDGFGIKPLCLLLRDDEVVFGSEVKAIAALRSLAIDGGVLGDLLTWGFMMEDASLYAGVRQLAPGTLLTLRRDERGRLQATPREVWPARQAYRQPGPEPSAAQLRAVIDASVVDHMIADVPVAIALSGGLDSSIVAAAAARHCPDLHAHTFTFADGSDPEVEHAALLCRHLGLRHHVARLVRGDVGAWLRRVAWHLEEPIANVNALPGYALGALVHAQGFKVALVGEGADELFGGYPWYRLALEPALARDPGALFDAYRKRRAQSGCVRFLRPPARDLLEQRRLAQRAAFAARLQEVRSSALDGFLSFELATQLQWSQLLRVDRMFMAHGVEARVPFLYRPVLEAAAALPVARKLRVGDDGGRMEKLALAEAFAADLPERVAARPKFGGQGTVDLWSTWLGDGVAREFDRCVHGAELRGARQLLEEFVDWSAVAAQSLTPKEKFALALLLESVDCVLLSRMPPDAALPVQWELYG